MKKFINYLYKLIKLNGLNAAGLWFFISVISWASSERTMIYGVLSGFIIALIIYIMITIEWLYINPLRKNK